MPLPSGYQPELDATPLLTDEAINYYQSELGRIDIYVDVAKLSHYLVNPRQGHLQAMYHIYAFLKRHDRCTMVFDDKILTFSSADFPEFDWMDFYGDVEEAIPPNAPEP